MRTKTMLLTSIIILGLISVSCNKEDDHNALSFNDQLKQSVSGTDIISLDADQISNHPDPFNSKTSIIFSVPNSATWTTLVIYTELIEKIAVLISGKLPSDDYDFEFDATGIADGTYIAKLNVGSIVFLEEMTKKSIVNSNNDVLLKE